MTLQTRLVSLSLLSHTGAILPGATISAQLSSYEVDVLDVVPMKWDFLESQLEPGVYLAQLWPNNRTSGGSSYRLLVQANGLVLKTAVITVQDVDQTHRVSIAANPPPYPPVYQAQSEVSAARVFSDAAGWSASRAGALAQAAGNSVLNAAASETKSALNATDARTFAEMAGARVFDFGWTEDGIGGLTDFGWTD